MKTSLDDLERAHRRTAKAEAAMQPPPPAWILFALAFGVTPFATAAVLFVPVFGQLLVLAALVLSLVYLFSLRSARCAAAALAGACLSLLFFSGLLTFLRERAGFLLFFLLALNIAVLIVYIVVVAGAIWHRAQDASKQEPTTSG